MRLQSLAIRTFTSAAVAASILLFAASSAQAAGSCSVFAIIKSYDAATESVTFQRFKGNERRFFPKTEGAPSTSKIPKPCSAKAMQQKSYKVTPTGGRMSVTQVRSNFEGKMQNKTGDPAWLPGKLKTLIDEKRRTVILLRQPPTDRTGDLAVTTIYLPVTQEEKDEIARLNSQAEDVD